VPFPFPGKTHIFTPPPPPKATREIRVRLKKINSSFDQLNLEKHGKTPSLGIDF